MAVVANVAINVDAKQGIGQVKALDQATDGLNKGLKAAAVGAQGLGAAIQAALGPLLAVTTAVTVFQKSLTTAFERAGAEQRLKNIVSGTEEYEAALALAANSAQKFGTTQTESTKALADVYARLKGVGFGLQETGQIYQGFNAIALQSGLAGEEAAGAFFQLSQALGKGKLNGDEFVIVAERMPQLLDAIAQTTGKSRGELTQMAQDGKITSQVLYDALAGAANASGQLNGKLTQQQKSFNDLRAVSDQLLNALGQVFGPVVVAGADVLAKAGQTLADWWGYLGATVFPQVQAALEPVITALKKAFADVNFDAIRVAIQNILIKGFEIVIGVVGKLSNVLAFVIGKFKELSQNPVFQFIAEQVGRLANFLGLTTDKVGAFKEEQNKANQSAAEAVQKYSSLPAPIDDAKEAAKQLKEQQQQVTKAIQDSTAAIDQSAKIAAAARDQQTSIALAYLDAEKQINNVLLEQANRRLDEAKTQEQRIAAAKDIYNLTVRQAELEYTAAQANIKAEVQKALLAVQIAEQKFKAVEAAVLLAKAEGTVVEEHYKALEAMRDAIDLAEIQAGTAAEVAVQQERAAKAVFDGQKQAALAAFQTNILTQETQSAANAAGQYAVNMQNAAGAVAQAANNIRTLEDVQAEINTLGRTSTQVATYTDEEMRQQGIGPYANAATRAAHQAKLYQERLFAESEDGTTGTRLSSAMGRYASGQQTDMSPSDSVGFSQSETTDLMGTAGRYSGGSAATRGSTYRRTTITPPKGKDPASINPMINVTTGPVINMDGKTYVSQSDFVAGMENASRRGAQMALEALGASGSTRRGVGLG